MGVKITSREYFNPNTAGVSDWLIGNTGDWQKLKLTFECAVEFVGDVSNKVQLEPDNKVYLLNGLNWSDYGFLPGQTITISFIITVLGSPVSVSGVFVIEELLGDLMLVDNTVATSPVIMPSQIGENDFIYDVFIYADLRPQGIEFSYGQITNEDFDTTALNSIIDGTIAQFKAINTDVIGIGSSQNLLQTGNKSGMSIKNPTITYVNKIGTHTYKYFIELEFMISSFFETLNDLENRIKPSWLEDTNCLTDNFFIKGYPVWNNPNSYVKNDMSLTKKLGNTGWFNENFNGYDNHFTIDSLEYLTIANQPLPTLDYANPTKVKTDISGIPNLAGGKFQFGLLWITNDTTVYKTNINQFHENLKLCHTKNGSYSDFFPISVSFDTNTYVGYSIDNAHIDVSDIRFSNIGGTVLRFEATFTPTSEFTELFESLNETDRKFVLWVSVADSSLDTNYSDRVSLLLDFNTYQKNIPPAGPYDNVEHTYYEHPESDGDLIIHNDNYVVSYIEDDFLVKLDFPKLIADNRIFKKFILKLDAEIGNTGEYYNLQTFIIDVSDFVIDVNGVQQINFDSTRGFKLEAGNNKNFVKAFIDSITLTEVNYKILYAFKVRWEDWIQRLGVPVEFYDNSLLNDGFNNDWEHYAGLTTNGLFFTLEIENEFNGELILNRNTVPFAPVLNYDTNICLTKTHKFYNHTDNTSLHVGIDPESGKPLNAILNNDFTRVEIDYTLDDPCGGYNSATLQALMLFYSLNPETIYIYATICIEIDKGAGQFEFRQLSSKWGYESDNPLIPIPGEDGTKIELLPDNITLRTSCLIDPNLLPTSARYKVTGRIKLSFKP